MRLFTSGIRFVLAVIKQISVSYFAQEKSYANSLPN